MEIISSYAVKLYTDKNDRAALLDTIQKYRAAVSYLAVIIKNNWESIGPVYTSNKKEAQALVEHLVHRTGKNPEPKYDFDTKFVKYPSYFVVPQLTQHLAL